MVCQELFPPLFVVSFKRSIKYYFFIVISKFKICLNYKIFIFQAVIAILQSQFLNDVFKLFLILLFSDWAQGLSTLRTEKPHGCRQTNLHQYLAKGPNDCPLTTALFQAIRITNLRFFYLPSLPLCNTPFEVTLTWMLNMKKT